MPSIAPIHPTMPDEDLADASPEREDAALDTSSLPPSDRPLGDTPEEPEGPEDDLDDSDVDSSDDEDDAEDDAEDDPEDDLDDDTDDEDDGEPSFRDLGLPEELLEAVTRMGYETPTPIQAEAIPALLAHRDVVGVAQTGTGKTAAFGLPILATIDPAERDVQALVLSPTRELAMQSSQAMEDFASRSRDVDIVAVYGGAPYGPQLHALRKGAQVVVGTPGRIIDLIEKGALDLGHVRVLILDEADEMLRMGFAEDVETIASGVPSERLTALFSATMPPAIARVADTHLTDPLRIAVTHQSSTVDTIHQTYAVVPFRHKIGALTRVLATRDTSEADAAIVFVRTRQDVEEIALEMSSRGFRAAGISGDVAQKERERMVERLRSGGLDVLVATDVAARGLDVERIGLVVNFDVPREAEAYVHRVGRTGRAGREGRSLTFFTPRERGRLRRIEQLTGTRMEEVPVPTPAEVSEFRARRVLDAVPGRAGRGRLELYHTLLEQLHDATDLDVADVAAALLARAVGDEGPAPRTDRHEGGRTRREEQVDEDGEFVAASFEEGRDGGRSDKGGRDGARRRGGARPVGSGLSRRYRVEVGKKDGVRPGAIVGAITGEGGIAGSDLGRIDIFPTFSLVEISGELSPTTVGRIAKARVSGRALRISEDEGPDAGRGPHHGHGDDEGRPGAGDRAGRGREDRRGSRDDHPWRGRDDREDTRDGRDRGFRDRRGSSGRRWEERTERTGGTGRDERGGHREQSGRTDRPERHRADEHRADHRFGGSRGEQGPRRRH